MQGLPSSHMLVASRSLAGRPLACQQPCRRPVSLAIRSPLLHSRRPRIQKAHSRPTYIRETSETGSCDIDWDNLDALFVQLTDNFYMAKCGTNGDFSKGEMLPLIPSTLNKFIGALNHGQGLIEDLNAYRQINGSIKVDRPHISAILMREGAHNMGMPAPTVEQFTDAATQTTLANKRWVPPVDKGSLCIRTMLMARGTAVGHGPAPEYTFTIFVYPVGNSFKEVLDPINLVIEDQIPRAAPGETGDMKTFGKYTTTRNYDSILKAQSIPKEKGYSAVLHLNANGNLEGVSSCNIFVLKGHVLSVPAIKGTILPGITRKSIIEVARSKGLKVEERHVSVEELLSADEVFVIGEKVAFSPVGSIAYKTKRKEYGNHGVGAVSQQLYSSLRSLQMGHAENMMGWTAGTVYLN